MSSFDCTRTRSRFDAWLDGATTSTEAAAVSEHVVACAGCAAALADDVRFSASVEDAFRLRVEAAANAGGGARRFPTTARRAAAAAAVIVSLWGAFAAGRASSPKAADDSERAEGDGGDAVETVRVADASSLGVFAPAEVVEAAVLDAERRLLASRVRALESTQARADLELAARRAVEGASVDASAVVRELASHVRAASPDDKQWGGGLWRRTHAAAKLLSVDRDRAVVAVRAWLDEASTAAERRTALKLLSMVRGAGAHEALAREATSGTETEAAIDGLLRLNDERSRPVYAAVADLPGAAPEIRIKALGGLHRLGDHSAAERLVTFFRAQEPPLRRKILYHLAARPTAYVVAELPPLMKAAEMKEEEKRVFVDMLAAAGGVDPRVLEERLGL